MIATIKIITSIEVEITTSVFIFITPRQLLGEGWRIETTKIGVLLSKFPRMSRLQIIRSRLA